ncbi:conserved hypothetical protein [Frankia canadensis]|uniref:Uncharacterized protein n=1 Tax=Frankia canadensis TaxID=1836972 RepID=A0A2I2KKN7_9ACTN|nr:hypothetical protein [Frankia canadensis]SNQ46223.1 conserved hypothetical protein [Frankia canadensis]SOU53513.1 conserved hypothetical protein [Frankia canadensis]
MSIVPVWEVDPLELPTLELPETDGLVLAGASGARDGSGGGCVEVEFLAVDADELLRRAVEAAAWPHIGSVTVHPGRDPAERTRLAFLIGRQLRLERSARGWDSPVVTLGSALRPEAAGGQGLRMVPHHVRLRCGDRWNRHTLWEVMGLRQYVTWLDRRAPG